MDNVTELLSVHCRVIRKCIKDGYFDFNLVSDDLHKMGQKSHVAKPADNVPLGLVLYRNAIQSSVMDANG